ncbi:phage holin [Desulfotomaculum copahuensis]|uniref:Phage holin n=1 Tax=Desulfotomaculum copahuensis TaxID=1838280 RepID=A0A1B7LDJ5_9FIRM|nr:phage holin [Desulfotomaculum copahuensis]OAT81122.1 phage holin [Desulfotomaculum copahuensis]
MEDKLLQLAYDLLAILIPVLAALAVEYLRRRLGTEMVKRIQEELATKQELATLAVRFVEQVYKDLHGPDKYQKAAEWLASRAQEHGLKLTADEIKGLIEAALRQLKDAFGNEWAKQLQ